MQALLAHATDSVLMLELVAVVKVCSMSPGQTYHLFSTMLQAMYIAVHDGQRDAALLRKACLKVIRDHGAPVVEVCALRLLRSLLVSRLKQLPRVQDASGLQAAGVPEVLAGHIGHYLRGALW